MLDLLALKDFPARVVLAENAEDLDLQVYGIKYRDRARVELDIIKSDSTYLCTGLVELKVELECSRCLDYYPSSLRGELDFSIRETAEGTPLDRGEIPDNQIIVPAGTQRVDISDPVREALILEVPLKPLCVENCRGLCPHCGGNRNERECQCRVEMTDTRWDDLRKLR